MLRNCLTKTNETQIYFALSTISDSLHFRRFTGKCTLQQRQFSISPPKARIFSTMAPVTVKAAAYDFLDFVNASPSPFHAVKSVKERLCKAGFKEIKVSYIPNIFAMCCLQSAGKRVVVINMYSWG